MQDFIEEQLGRLLLAAAIAWAAAATFAGGAAPLHLSGLDEVKDPERLQVELGAAQQAPKEAYFPAGDAELYRGSARHVFVKPKVVKQYEAVELEVPPAAVMRPPGMVTSPGPGLDGTANLPRWGEELPPPPVTPPPAPKKP